MRLEQEYDGLLANSVALPMPLLSNHQGYQPLDRLLAYRDQTALGLVQVQRDIEDETDENDEANRAGKVRFV